MPIVRHEVYLTIMWGVTIASHSSGYLRARATSYRSKGGTASTRRNEAATLVVYDKFGPALGASLFVGLSIDPSRAILRSQTGQQSPLPQGRGPSRTV